MVEKELSKVKADLVTTKANSALEKGKMELEMAKAKLELVKAKKEATEVVLKYKASTAEKARAMADFHKSKEFFVDCRLFSQEACEEGFRTGELECRNAVLNHFQGIKLDFLDEEELEGEPIDASIEVPLGWTCCHT